MDSPLPRLLALLRRHPLATLLLANLVVTLLVYMSLYHEEEHHIYLSFQGLSITNIQRYWDGPLYLVVAKTFYHVADPALHVFPDLPPTYYAAHFPTYPALIRAFTLVLSYPQAMLAATIAATSVLLWLGLVALVLPPRWLIYHSVGASEPLFIAASATGSAASLAPSLS